MTPAGTLIASEGVFVGRRPEFELVSRALEATRASSPQVVVIEGEPGIGKTAFLRHCIVQAPDVIVLEASGDESEANLDFGVVAQLVSRAPAVARSEPLNELLATSSPPPSSFSVGAEFLGLLGSIQDAGPVALVLDDAQWIDKASAGALLFALRRLYGDRVCALIATRPDDLEMPGSSWSRFLSDAERVRRMTLSGLGRRDVSVLASSLSAVPVTLPAAERLREHTGGHPLYVRTLLRELSAEALALEQGPLPAPHSFAATVLARLTSVSAPTQDLVAAAAVAGARCEVTLAGAAAGLSDPIGAFDEALAADLLTLAPTRMPMELAFPHPLVRAAVYDDLSLTRRRELHLACARLTSGAASLAHRVAASAGGDDALAAELADTGQAEVADGKLAAGIDHLLLASRIAESTATREHALMQAVNYLGIAGDVPRAQGLREAVAACGDSPHRSFALATLTASAGRLPEAIAALQGVTERPDFPSHPELFGAVGSSLAIICAYAGRGSEAVEWARRTMDEQRLTATVELTAKQALALGLAISGRPNDGISALEPLPGSRLAPGPFEPELVATRGHLKLRAGDLAGALEDLSTVISRSRAGTVPRSLANAYSSMAEAEYRLGRWEEGPTHADLAIALAQDSDQVWELPFAHAVASFFHAARAEWALAGEHVDAAHRAAELAPLPLSVYHAAIASANLAAVRGDWGAVLSALEPVRSQDVGPGQRGRELEVEALLRTGRLVEAARLLEQCDDDAGASSAAETRVEHCRLRGELAYLRGEPGEARDAFAAGEEAAKQADAPLASGVLELAYGYVLRKSGRRSAATARLQAARRLLTGLGAAAFLERCDAELAACGVRPAASGTDDYGLSAREQLVARLVAAGKSNREVGAELYLSTKAIEYHLANIFRKVGVRSRHQLAARLAPPH